MTRAARPREHITFAGGLDAPFHRWFRLTPSFSPHLVDEWLDRHPVEPGQFVGEPFLGAGTTGITAAARGLDVVGNEINPLLAFVSRVSSTWSLDADLFAKRLTAVTLAAKAWRSEYGTDDPETFATALGTTVPPIHNVSRWWHDSVLCDLLAIRESAKQRGAEARDHLLLGLAAIVYSTANITLGRLQIAFVDRDPGDIDVFGLFAEAAGAIGEDLRDSKPPKQGNVTVSLKDSRLGFDAQEGSIGTVFTSPPYPNRYSYVWNTRPHLYLLEFIDTAKAAADIDVDTLAGTWGRATSLLQKGRVDPSELVEAASEGVLENLYERDVLMGNYVTKYLNDLEAQIVSMTPSLAPNARVGYVVGNTETKGLMIDVQHILARMFEGLGYRDVDLDVLRGRNSGAGLLEVTVEATSTN